MNALVVVLNPGHTEPGIERNLAPLDVPFRATLALYASAKRICPAQGGRYWPQYARHAIDELGPDPEIHMACPANPSKGTCTRR